MVRSGVRDALISGFSCYRKARMVSNMEATVVREEARSKFFVETSKVGYTVECLADPECKKQRGFCWPDEERNGDYRLI